MVDINESIGDASTTNMLMRFLWKCATLCTGVVTLLMGVLYVKQEALLYHPAVGGMPRNTSQNPRRYRSPSEHNVPFETIMIECADGTTLHSWLLYHPDNANKNDTKVPTIIFFHGNAGNIGHRLPNAVQMYYYLKANIWLIEYRGFGDSDNIAPNESGLKLDAEAVWNYAHLNHIRNVDTKRLFVFGRSLGGAVAFHLAQYSQSAASKFPPLAGLLIENSFLSISQMVDHLMPAVAPFKMLILRMNWNSGQIAPTLRIPTLFLAGAKDTLVPHSHMVELYNRMKMTTNKMVNGRKNLVVLHVVKNGTHNETWMQGGKHYWLSIQRFLEEVFEAEQANDASFSKSVSSGIVKNSGSSENGPIQRKGRMNLSSLPISATSVSNASAEKLEVDMGCEGENAADMISSVGTLLGMAREAVSGEVQSGVGTGTYKKKE